MTHHVNKSHKPEAFRIWKNELPWGLQQPDSYSAGLTESLPTALSPRAHLKKGTWGKQLQLNYLTTALACPADGPSHKPCYLLKHTLEIGSLYPDKVLMPEFLQTSLIPPLIR